jgi:hypothetical protein
MPDPLPPEASTDSPTTAEEELQDFERRLQLLQTQLNDLKELLRLEQLPPERWQEFQDQLQALEEQMKSYLGDLNPMPMLFWQVVRLGGLGFLLGILVQRWLGES